MERRRVHAWTSTRPNFDMKLEMWSICVSDQMRETEHFVLFVSLVLGQV